VSIIKQFLERTRKITDCLLKSEPFKYSSFLPWIESMYCKRMLVHIYLIPTPFTNGKKKTKNQANYMKGKIPIILDKIELSQRNLELIQPDLQLMY